MSLPRAILIDLDDTILDDSGNVDACWETACTEASVRAGLDAEKMQLTIRRHASEWWGDAERHRRVRLDLRAATTEIVAAALAELGDEQTDMARVIANRYRDLREEGTALLPGALETLEWLRARGVRLGMMTNGAGPAQRAKIKRFGLAKYFDHILIEGEFGCGKPDARVFQTLLAALETVPAETWAIGDNVMWDVYGAMDVGIHGIWIDPSGKGVPVDWREPDRTVTALSELVAS